MKTKTLLATSMSVLMLASCGSSDDSTELTGIWESSSSNELYLIIENSDSLLISVCAAEGEATEMLKEDLENNAELNIISSSEIEFVENSEVTGGLTRISTQDHFDSGTFIVESSEYENLSATENVCAFRGTDNIRNTIAAPYLDGYLELVILNNAQTTGEFDLSSSDDITIFFESHASLNDGFGSGYSGTVNILEYTDEKFNAEYNVYDSSGNEYAGSVNVGIN